MSSALPMSDTERQALNVSRVMGTSELSETTFASSSGKLFRNVSVAEKKLTEQLGLPRYYGNEQIKPLGSGIDMSSVQKPVRGAEEIGITSGTFGTREGVYCRV